MKKLNYQIMSEDNKNNVGRYIPNWEQLLSNASSDEEIAYINSVISNMKEWAKNDFMKDSIGFSFNMVYVMRQACGHFEIFQTHASSQEQAMEWLEIMLKESNIRKCTSCICGR